MMFIKTYFEKIKKAAMILSSAFVLIIASIIVLNTVRPSDPNEMSVPDKIYRHFIYDHGANKNVFGFININFSTFKNYFDEKSPMEISVSAAVSLFLILSNIIFYNQNKRELYYAEKFFIVNGFNSPVYRPPRSFS